MTDNLFGFAPGQSVRVNSRESMFYHEVGTVIACYANELGEWIRVDFGEEHYRRVPFHPEELEPGRHAAR